MLKYIRPLLMPFTVALVISGCDSQSLAVVSDEIDLNLENRGIDMEAAKADPSGIAEIPKFLLATDTIRHGNIGSLDTRQVSQLDDGIINSAGQLEVDNITCTWRRSEEETGLATFSLSTANRWPETDREKLNFYRNIMDTVIAAASGSSNSINQALNNLSDSSTPKVLTDAAASVGFLTAIGPEPWFAPGSLQPYVLMERSILYTVTSTNQQLIDDNVISGTFAFADRWGLPSLLSVEEVGSPVMFDQVELAHIPSPFFLFSATDASGGTFTITIND